MTLFSRFDLFAFGLTKGQNRLFFLNKEFEPYLLVPKEPRNFFAHPSLPGTIMKTETLYMDQTATVTLATL